MFNRYPYTNFHELNLDYFIQHFNEIFTEWKQLYNELQSWKTDTTEELDQWRADVEKDLDDREAALRAELEIWKQDTADDISDWETATLNALDAWKTAATAQFEAIRVQAAASAEAAAASQTAAASAAAAALLSETAAEEAAAAIQSSAAQIQQNSDDIDDLKTQLKPLEYAVSYFYWTAGTEHSSTKDRVNIDIKSGETFYVTLTTTSRILYGIYGIETDDSSVKIQNAYSNEKKTIVASADLKAIAIYINSTQSGESGDVRVLVEKSNSILAKTADIDVIERELNLKAIELTNYRSYFPTNANGQIIDPTSPSSNNNFNCVAVPCTAGETYTINAGGANSASTRPWAVIGSDNKIIVKASANIAHDVVTIPDGGVFLIINNRVESYPDLVSFYGETVNAKVDYLDSQIRDSMQNVINGVKCYGEISFTVAANTAHSSTADRMAVDIKAGDVFTVEVSRSDTHDTEKTGTIYLGRKVAGLANETASITFSGIKKIITAPYDIAYLGIYIGAQTYAQTYTVTVAPYNEVKTAETVEENAIIKGNIAKNSTTNILFFSDVHAAQNNVQRIVDYANENADMLSCVINGGDTVLNDASEGISWYNDIVDTSVVDMLMAVGNHDVWANTDHDKLPAADVYTNYIAPIAAKVSNLVQPTGAASAGKCYYYKDYNAVRVVVLNAMYGVESVQYWDNDEATWLTNILADAKTNNKHVLIVNHMPFKEADRVVNHESQWTSYDVYGTAGVYLVPEAVTIVQTFIGGGGIFVGWLTGHTHRDTVMRHSNGQWMFTISTAHYPDANFHVDGFGFSTAMSSSMLYPTYDCFNVIGIDTANKILKMTRVGWNMDSAMKKRTAYAFNYGTGDVYTDR